MVPPIVQVGDPVSAAAHNALLREVDALRREVDRLTGIVATLSALPRVLPARVTAVHGAAPGAEALAGTITYDVRAVGRTDQATLEQVAPDVGRPCDADTMVTAAQIGQVCLIVRAPKLNDQGQPDGFENCLLLGETVQFGPC